MRVFEIMQIRLSFIAALPILLAVACSTQVSEEEAIQAALAYIESNDAFSTNMWKAT